MCVIVIKPNNVTIPLKTIRKMFLANPDGTGIAYVKGESVVVRKGLFSASEVYKALKPLHSLEVAVHFRLATHGHVTADNTHPFVIARKQPDAIRYKTDKPIVMHNGIISGFGSQVLSDTKDFTQSILAKVAERDTLALLTAIGDKFALVTLDGIITVGKFFQVGDLEVSNTHWNWSERIDNKTTTLSKGWTWKDDELVNDDDDDSLLNGWSYAGYKDDDKVN